MPSAANDAAARSLANMSIFPCLARSKSGRTCHNMNIKRAVTHPSAHSFASIRRDWRKPPGAGNRWRLVLHQLPKQKKVQNKKKNEGSTLGPSASRLHRGVTSCLLPPTSAAPPAVFPGQPPRVVGGRGYGGEGGRSPVSGSLLLRNWGQPLSSVDLGGAEVQRSAGERQEGRHSPPRPFPPLPSRR